MKSQLIRLCFVAGLVFSGCSDREEQGRHCYRNEFPFPDNPADKDVQELTLEISGATVTGSYNWLPAFKDRRVGELSGTTRDGRVISGDYSFTQEGQTLTEQIEITIDSDRAVVRGTSPERGLDADISRIDCTTP